jgi:hypothetical protein
MRTTLNFPDDLILKAKMQAVRDKTTLTDIIVQGLELRLKQDKIAGTLPVSKSGGGLRKGISWKELRSKKPEDEQYR